SKRRKRRAPSVAASPRCAVSRVANLLAVSNPTPRRLAIGDTAGCQHALRNTVSCESLLDFKLAHWYHEPAVCHGRLVQLPVFFSEERYSTRSTRSCVDIACCKPAGMIESFCWSFLATSLFLYLVTMPVWAFTAIS